MKFKTTWLLGLALAVGAFALYFFDIKPTDEKAVEEKLAKRLVSFEPDSVAAIEQTADGITIRASKAGEDWVLLEPHAVAGDKSIINGALRSISRIETERLIIEGEGVNLANYGLGAPRSKYVITLNSGEIMSFIVGDESPTGSFVFTATGQMDKVFTVPKRLHTLTSKKFFDMRDKRLLFYNRGEGQKVTVHGTKHSFELARLGSDFMLMEPANLNTEKSKASGYFSRLSGAKAKKYIDENIPPDSKTGLGKPSLEIEILTGATLEKHRLIFGGKVREDGKPYRYVRDTSRPEIMLVDSSLFAYLDMNPFTLAEKRILNFERDKADGFEIRYEDNLIRLEKSGTAWSVVEPDSFPADSVKVARLLSKFSVLKAIGIEDYAPSDFDRYGMGSPDLTVIITGVEGELNSIRAGSEVGDERYVKAGGSPPIYRIKKKSLDDLKKDSDYFRAEGDKKEAS